MPTTTPKQLLKENDGALVVMEGDYAYMYFLGNLMDGARTIPLSCYDEMLHTKYADLNDIRAIYSPTTNKEISLKSENRKILWERKTPRFTVDVVLKTAIDTYGFHSQQDMVIEEMSELTKALIKYRRAESKADCISQKLFDDIAEEIADVEITLAQLKIMFKNQAEVDKWKSEKLKRLEERLSKK